MFFLSILLIGFLFYRRRESARTIDQDSNIQVLTKQNKSLLPSPKMTFELEGDAGRGHELEVNYGIPELDGCSKDELDVQEISELRASIATAKEHKIETRESRRGSIYEMRTSIATTTVKWREGERSTKEETRSSFAMTEASDC